MSKKRVLPALILAGSLGFLGLHRFYAGRYITGLIQLVCFSISFMMLKNDLIGFVTGFQAAIQNVDDLQDWIIQRQAQPLPLFPVILLSISSIWAVVDCLLLAMRKFRDSRGELMTQWT